MYKKASIILGLTLLTSCTNLPNTSFANENLKEFQTCEASFYGNGEKLSSHTANGERFNRHSITAAHKTLPFNTKLKVVNLKNNRSVVVRITDRGPFVKGRCIDLTYGAAQSIGMVSTSPVKIYLVK